MAEAWLPTSTFPVDIQEDVIVGFRIHTVWLGGDNGFHAPGGISNVTVCKFADVYDKTKWRTDPTYTGCGGTDVIEEHGFVPGYALTNIITYRFYLEQTQSTKSIRSIFNWCWGPNEKAGLLAAKPPIQKVTGYEGLYKNQYAGWVHQFTDGQLNGGVGIQDGKIPPPYDTSYVGTDDPAFRLIRKEHSQVFINRIDMWWYDSREQWGRIHRIMQVTINPNTSTWIDMYNNQYDNAATLVGFCKGNPVFGSVAYRIGDMLTRGRGCSTIVADVCGRKENMDLAGCKAYLVANPGVADAEVTAYCATNNRIATDNFCACNRKIQASSGLPADTVAAMNAQPRCWDATCMNEGYKTMGQQTTVCNLSIMNCIQSAQTGFDGAKITGDVTFKSSIDCKQVSGSPDAAAAAGAPTTPPPPPPPTPTPVPVAAPAAAAAPVPTPAPVNTAAAITPTAPETAESVPTRIGIPSTWLWVVGSGLCLVIVAGAGFAYARSRAHAKLLATGHGTRPHAAHGDHVGHAKLLHDDAGSGRVGHAKLIQHTQHAPRAHAPK